MTFTCYKRAFSSIVSRITLFVSSQNVFVDMTTLLLCSTFTYMLILFPRFFSSCFFKLKTLNHAHWRGGFLQGKKLDGFCQNVLYFLCFSCSVSSHLTVLRKMDIFWIFLSRKISSNVNQFTLSSKSILFLLPFFLIFFW